MSHGPPDTSNYDIPDIKVTPLNTDFLEHKRCFELCVRDMKTSGLDEKEENCTRNCLSKHFQAQVFLSQKMYNEMAKLITNQPQYQQMFAKKPEGPNFKLKNQ